MQMFAKVQDGNVNSAFQASPAYGADWNEKSGKDSPKGKKVQNQRSADEPHHPLTSDAICLSEPIPQRILE